MTNSNLVGCSTGRSAGFAPRRIFVDEVGGAPEQVPIIGSIGRETARFYVHPLIVNHGQSRDDCQGVDINHVDDYAARSRQARDEASANRISD